MSEKIYRLLLRLYPSRFRTRYGQEAMQVFRDRLRDERGLLRRTRFWLDVLRDLIVSAPREYSRIAVRPAPVRSGVPSFLVLEEEPLRPDKFLIGTVLALLAVGTFGYLLTHGGNRRVFPAIGSPLYRARGLAAVSGAAQMRPHPNAEGEAIPVPAVSFAERRLVLRKVMEAVQKLDPDPAEGRSLAAVLAVHERRGDYDGLVKGPVFAAVLSSETNGLARHLTVTVLCGQQPLPGNSLWVAPSRPGHRAWLRIDDHFSVVLMPR